MSARSSDPTVGWRYANPSRLDPDGLPALVEGTDLVVVRLLGGRRAWQEGLDTLLAGPRPVVVLTGEQAPDAELMGLSTVPAGIAAQAHAYLAHGGPRNVGQLALFLSDTVLLTGHGFDQPEPAPAWGRLERDGATGSGPVVAVLYYRAHQMSGNTTFVETLCDQVVAAGGRPLPVWCASLRDADPGLLAELRQADVVVTTVLAAGGTRPADAQAGGDDEAWDAGALGDLGVPILQALCLTSPRDSWLASGEGVSPLDAATQIAVPEFDGRVITVPFSFKEFGPDGLPAYVPDVERAARVAGLAVAHGRLRHLEPCRPPGRPRPVGLPDQACADRQRGRPRHLGQRRGPADTPARGRLGPRARDRPGRAAGAVLRQRGRADPRVDRGRRLRRGVAHAGPAGRQPGPHRRRRLPAVVRHPAGRVARGGRAALGAGARCAVRRHVPKPRGRHRPGRAARRKPAGAGATATRVRRQSHCDLPRSGSAALAPLPRGLPLDRCRTGRRGIRRGRGRPPGQARQPGMAPRQERRAVCRVRPRRRPGEPAAGVPLPRQRPRRGHAGQAPGTRRAGGPPRPADGAGRELRRHRPAGAAAGRARQHRGPRPGQAAGRPGPDLDPAAGRQAGPRPGPVGPSGRRAVRRARHARRRLAL